MMKSIIMASSLIVVLAGCEKNQTEQPTGSIQNQQIPDMEMTNRLLKFKERLQHKEGGYMSPDSSTWYVEGLLNYEQANNDHSMVNVNFYNDSIALEAPNGDLSIEQLHVAYDYFSDKIEEIITAQNNPGFKMDVINIEIEGSQLKDGIVTMSMNATGGSQVLFNYTLFGPTDYWRWGWDLGKCGGYTGGIGQDATDQLEDRFNNPLSLTQGGYFTSITVSVVYCNDYEDMSSPSGYMLFLASGPGQAPVEEPCISPDELNYYLSKFDYIKADRKPANKSFARVNVYEEVGLYTTEWLRGHNYDIYYGNLIANPN